MTLALTLAACTSSGTHPAASSAAVASTVPATGSSAAVSAPGRPSAASSSTIAKSSSTRPAPSTGINVTVPSRAVTTKAPVGLQGTGSFSSTVTVRLASARKVTTQAHGPGEISGPGARLTFRLSNGTSRALDLDQVVVNVSDQQGNPGSPVTDPSASPFHGTVAPHGAATGVYVFTVKDITTTRLRIEISYSPTAATVVFTGTIK